MNAHKNKRRNNKMNKKRTKKKKVKAIDKQTLPFLTLHRKIWFTEQV